MNLRRPAATSGVAAALLALAPSALAVPTPIAAERVIIDFKGRKGHDPGTLASRLQGNCVPVSALPGWSVDFDGIDGTWAGGPLRTTGSIDVAARRGAVASTAGGLRFESQFRRPGDGRPKSLRMTHVGVELAGRRAYMTARLSPSPRQRRVGLIRRPRLLSGQLHDPDDGSDIPGTYAVAVQGKVTLTKVLARELHRRRCRDLASQGSGPVRAGRAMGRLTAQLLASRATGSAGTLPVAAAVATEAGDAVAATDAAGAPLPPDDDGTPALAMPVAPGSATALGCVILARFPTQACAPFGGTVALTGAIVLRLGSRATTVANLAVAYAADARSDSFPSRTLSATIDGAPVTFATSTAGESSMDTTPAALAALGAALGAPVEGGLFPGEPSFTTVGPP